MSTLGPTRKNQYTISAFKAGSVQIPYSLTNEITVKSTLVEPVPDSDGLDEDSMDFIRASSVQDLAAQTNIGDEEILDRVLLPGKRFGAYHILGFVAAGGMGEIYAAQRIKSDGSRSRPVALKVITAEFANDWRIIERFKREAKISKAIRSRHVARVYEFGESPQGHAFLAMELLNGEELFDRLHRHKLFSPMEVAELSLQILKGLHKIHKSGFVHRDIKPENIFLAKDPKTQEEAVKILDFGIAKRADKKSDPLLSVVGQIYGTPQYLAPEQAINPDVDHRADLYSLGVVMYECVTGSLPFEGESSYDLIVAHQKDEVPPLPSSVDPEFAHIIHQALAKEPEMRFQSALEMGRLIKRWVDETSWIEEDEPELSISTADDALKLETAKTIPRQKNAPPASSPPLSPTVVSDAFEAAPTEISHPAPQADDDLAPTAIAPAQPAAPSRPSPPLRPAAAQPPGAAPNPQPDSQESLPPPGPDATTEFRSPLRPAEEEKLSESDTRNAQIITGVALGIIILALLWAFVF